MLTAQHLFGETGGMSRDFTGAEMPDLVTGVTADSADDTGVTVTSDELVTISEAVPLTEDIRRDLAVFVVREPGSARVLTLADDIPQPDEPVFLLAQTADGSTPQLYPAVLSDIGSDNGTYLQYQFTPEAGLTDDLMVGTSGAPLFDADGAVVGVHVGGEAIEGTTLGYANAITSVRQALEANL